MPKKKPQTPADRTYAALCAESKKHGLPQSFATDLHVHDLNMLRSSDCPAAFGWLLYTCGTHVISADKYRSTMTETRIRERVVTVRTPGGPEPRLYLVEGERVTEATPADLAYVLSGERDRDRRQERGNGDQG